MDKLAQYREYVQTLVRQYDENYSMEEDAGF